ncbi:MAG TPA: VOC family protein [Myxococcus sp.]|nr:VOC family protein [Myxococcus sp.]
MRPFFKLLISDAARSVAFYEALGFERLGAEPPFVQLTWAGQVDVYLVTPPAAVKLEGRRGLGVLLGFRADSVGGVDEVLLRAQTQGAVVEGPAVQPWYTRELIITDPDGYRLNFIEPA